MICHEYKCIFIHVPKNAGTTIIQSFGKQWGNYDTSFLLSGKYSPKEHWIEYATKYSDYFVFSVIRNPWDKFISGWKYCNGIKNKSFDDVLFNLPKRGHDYIHLTRTQFDTISYNGDLIPNFLIRMENLQSDYDMVCDFIGKPRKTIGWFNKTEHLPYKEYFKNDKQLECFYKHYHDDIERFNYKF